jgi:hypothetical protein
MASASDRIYFAYKVNCEPLRARSPMCGGPETWDESELTIRAIRDVFETRGLRRALTFLPTPEAAQAHAPLWREWHAEGVGLGVQPNVPGFRFPTYEKDLGQYSEAMQRRIIAEAVDDFTQALGFRPESYVPCCGSRSAVTLRLLYEAGFRQMGTPAPGRYFPDRPDRCTVGVFPFPHWGNAAHHLVPGWLPLCIVPNSSDLSGGRGARPTDLRAEAPVGEATRARYRQIVDQAIEISGLIEAPVRTVVGNTHNTGFVHAENVAYVVDYVQEAVAQAGLQLVPASFPDIRAALETALPLPEGAPALR